MRTFVSFMADFPTDSQPPGRELADFIALALDSAAEQHHAVTEREGWAWELAADRGKATIESIVGLVDDPPVQWLITTHGHLGTLARFSRSARNERDAALLRWCQAVHTAISADDRFSEVRWYSPSDFDRSPDKWATTPG